jgi:Glycosyl hydrolase family 26
MAGRLRAQFKVLMALVSVVALAAGVARASKPDPGNIRPVVAEPAAKRSHHPVTINLSRPTHHGLVPGQWVGDATDTVTATASVKRGSGIRSLTLSGTHMTRAPHAGPRCKTKCPRTYTGHLTYNTTRMPDGNNKVIERAVSVGGVRSAARSWRLNVDHGRPTVSLGGALAAANNASVDVRSYGLAIHSRDTNGSKPSAGIAQISVSVDGKPQAGISGFKSCAIGAHCPTSISASWTFVASHYPAGRRTVTVAVTDSAHNVSRSNVTVTVAPRMFWGATIGTQFTGGEPPFDWNAETKFADMDAGGKLPSVVSYGQMFYDPNCTSQGLYPSGHYCPFLTSTFDAVRQRGYIPFVSWGSTDNGNLADPNFRDAAVAHGSQDKYIRQWALDAKAWGHPFFLRFDWEMNGSWWNFGTGGGHAPNTATDFVAMWRHVHDIFSQVGATNVTWVWCPNFDSPGEASMSSLYPGDAYVDWTCLDGYNIGSPWTSFYDRFGPSYDEVGKFAPNKPMMIGETSSTASGGSKSSWITQMFSDLPVKLPRIRGLVWYDVNAQGPGGRTDWPIEGSDPNHPDSASIKAFTAGISADRYTTNGYSQLQGGAIAAPT